MNNNRVRVAIIAVAALLGSAAGAQQTAKIDFKSVGRAAPLLVDINKQDIVGSAIRRSFGQPQPAADEGAFIGSARNGERRRASSRWRSTSSRRRISTRTARSGATSATSAATARAALEDAVGREPPRLDRRQAACHGRVGLLRPRLSARGDREPVSVQDGAGALRGAARGDDEARRPDAAHLRDACPDEWTGRYMHPGARRTTRTGIGMRHDPDADGPVAADAGVPDAHGAGGLSRRQHEQRAVAVAVLLARRLHAALARGRRLGAPRSSSRRRSCRSWPASRATSSPTSTSAASSTWSGDVPRLGADVPRWYGETIGFWDRRRADHLDVEHPGLEGARRLRVLEQAADDRDLHAEPRRRRQVPRPQPRGDLLRPRSARGAGAHRPQPRASSAASRKATRTPSSSACRRSTRSTARRRRSRPAPMIEYEVPDMYGRPWAQIWEKYCEQGMERPRRARTSSTSRTNGSSG